MCYTPSNPPVESIPALIKSKRKERGLTQRALGEMCGYTGASAERVVQLCRRAGNPGGFARAVSLHREDFGIVRRSVQQRNGVHKNNLLLAAA